MSKLQVRALLYQLACFAALFLLVRYLAAKFVPVNEMWSGIIAFVVTTLLSPKFQATRTRDGEKLFMSWLFVKGVREIK